jgi:hypothetical protein
VDNNWDEFFAFDSKTPELPAPKQSVVTPKKTTPTPAPRKPTPISPLNRRRSNLRDYMVNHVTPPTTDDDDWDKDFEGGLTLRSPQVTSPPPIPPLPPLSPKKTPSSPRKLSPPKLSAGNVSDDNSKTIRPATVSRASQSRKASAESSTSSSSNTVRAVSVSPLPMANRKPGPKTTTALKKRSKGRKIPSREDLSDDGYEDLIKGDESKFNMKVNSLKVRLSKYYANGSVTSLPPRDYYTPLI